MDCNNLISWDRVEVKEFISCVQRVWSKFCLKKGGGLCVLFKTTSPGSLLIMEAYKYSNVHLNTLRLTARWQDICEFSAGKIALYLVRRVQSPPQFKNVVTSPEPNIIEVYIQPSQVMFVKKHVWVSFISLEKILFDGH